MDFDEYPDSDLQQNRINLFLTHTHLSTKFHLNPSTTFWDIVRYIILAQSLNGEESLKKFSSRIRIFTNI